MRRSLPLWVVLAGCSGEPRRAEEAMVFRVGTHSELTEPSPFAAAGLGTTIEELVFRGLLFKDPDGQLVDDLATKQFVPDGSGIRLQLRPGSRFSDGTRVTSRDVADTLERARNVRFLRWHDQIREVRIIDAETVEVKTARPNTIPVALMVGIAKSGSPGPIGDGPYVVASRDGGKLVLRANPLWTGAPPGVKTIEFDRFQRGSDEWGRLLAREVDLITFIPWAKHEFLQTIPAIREVSSLSKTLYQIHFVHPAPPFDAPEVRYALSLAIDRAALVNAVVRGHGRPAAGLVWPRAREFDATLSPYPYDPAEARRILSRHGIAPGLDGRLRWNGQPLRLGITYLNGFTEVEESALLVQRQLDEIGLRVDLEGAPLGEMGRAIELDHAAALLVPWHATDDLFADPDARPFLASIASDAPGAHAQLQKRIRDAPPSIYLFWPERLDVISRRFCGLPRLPEGPEPELHLVHPCAPGEDD